MGGHDTGSITGTIRDHARGGQSELGEDFSVTLDKPRACVDKYAPPHVGVDGAVALAACRTKLGTFRVRTDRLSQGFNERARMSHFRRCDPDTPYLMPPPVDEWLPGRGHYTFLAKR